MPLVDINWQPSAKELRVFALLLVPFLALVAWFVAARWEAHTAAGLILGAAMVLGCAGLAWPAVLRPVYQVWMIAVFPIGWTISHLAMALLFYLVFTPVGLIMRACGRDPLERQWDRAARTYWKPRSPNPDKKRYFRQF